jgi:hypothetical protein
MDVLSGIVDFAQHVSIRHVLVLNLFGWGVKCVLRHRGWLHWTDIIPVILGVAGITLAAFGRVDYGENFIIYGLANAGLAWLLHRVVKPIPFSDMRESAKRKFK